MDLIDLDKIWTVNSILENKFFEPWTKIGVVLVWPPAFRLPMTVMTQISMTVIDMWLYSGIGYYDNDWPDNECHVISYYDNDWNGSILIHDDGGGGEIFL